ncbi:CoA ester lyase [Ostreiculturibacter nitratireducens]|uniref:HpcH/HpaI aldolase/citrate lyase family protein n=1 Tax=Ostreiculturibacter nitratireducens TaxID=3075226 RepID=UPI0031B5C618
MQHPLWRSLLYTPAHVQKYARKAAEGDADVVVLDLEDSVPHQEKFAARALLADSAALLHRARKQVAVRLNAEAAAQAEDLRAALAAGADILILPKIETPETVRRIASALAERVPGPPPVLIGLIETPAGLLNAAEIAMAHPLLKALNLGTEDFAGEMGMEPDWTALLYPSQQIAIAARRAGIVPLGYVGSIAQFRDEDAFVRIVDASARLGFEGGFAIHPSQVAALNRAFTPSEDRVAHARRVVSAFTQAEREGIGAVSVDGRMVDLPVVRRAEKILARAAAIANSTS